MTAVCRAARPVPRARCLRIKRAGPVKKMFSRTAEFQAAQLGVMVRIAGGLGHRGLCCTGQALAEQARLGDAARAEPARGGPTRAESV